MATTYSAGWILEHDESCQSKDWVGVRTAVFWFRPSTQQKNHKQRCFLETRKKAFLSKDRPTFGHLTSRSFHSRTGHCTARPVPFRPRCDTERRTERVGQDDQGNGLEDGVRGCPTNSSTRQHFETDLTSKDIPILKPTLFCFCDTNPGIIPHHSNSAYVFTIYAKKAALDFNPRKKIACPVFFPGHLNPSLWTGSTKRISASNPATIVSMC